MFCFLFPVRDPPYELSTAYLAGYYKRLMDVVTRERQITLLQRSQNRLGYYKELMISDKSDHYKVRNKLLLQRIQRKCFCKKVK